MLRAGVPQVGEIVRLASAGAQFARQQAHQGQPDPLADAKGLKELALGVFKGGRNRVHSGESQAYTSDVVEWGQGTANMRAGQMNFESGVEAIHDQSLGMRTQKFLHGKQRRTK